MFPKIGLSELIICLVPVLVIGGLIIAIFVTQRKKTDITETNLQPDTQSDDQLSSGIPGEEKTIESIENTEISQNGLATTSLFISIVALIIYIFNASFSGCTGLIAVVIGLISIIQINKQGSKGKTLALIGIGLGALPFVITLCLTTVLLLDVKP